MNSGMLVAGIGNIFLSDDGFGVEVVSRLAGAALPDEVRVTDYGIRGMHLAYDLASGYDSAILIDAAPRGQAPGTVYVIEPDLSPGRQADDSCPVGMARGISTGHPQRGPDAPEADGVGGSDVADEAGGVAGGAGGGLAASPFFDAHGMQPDVVFSMLDQLSGPRPGRILVVGCEPATVEYGMGLSEPVAAAVDEAVRVVLDLVAEHASNPRSHPAARGPQPAPGAPAPGPGPLLAEPMDGGVGHVPRHSR
jgi:hydrogenase maturation protease